MNYSTAIAPYFFTISNIVKDYEAVLSWNFGLRFCWDIIIIGCTFFYSIETSISRSKHFSNPSCRFIAFGLHQFNTFFYTNGIPYFEWSVFPTETCFHGVINFVEFVCYFWNSIGAIGKHSREILSIEITRFVFSFNQDFETVDRFINCFGQF